MTTWFVNSTATGTGAGTSWTNAFVSLSAAIANPIVAGDWIWVGDNSAETYATAINLTFPGTAANPNIIVCADHTVTTPGTSNWKTAGTVSCTANGAMGFLGSFYMYGLTLTCGPAAGGSVSLSLAQANLNWQKYDTCKIVNAGTTAANIGFQFGVANAVQASCLIFYNTTVQFGTAATQNIAIRACQFTWQNTASAIAGSNFPTPLFTTTIYGGNTVTIEGVDLSSYGSGKTLVANESATSRVYLLNCKLGASVTIAATPTNPGGIYTYVCNSDSGATNNRLEQYRYEGTQTISTSVVRTGGASDGVTPVSWQIVSSTNATFYNPYVSLLIDQWNTSTGSSRNAFLRGIWNNSALPTNAQIWMEAQSLGSSATPISTFTNNSLANASASPANLTADTSAWDSQITAWIASHAYTITQTMTLGNGQVYFCTGSGTSGSSPPTAVSDGSSTATDGSVSWRAAVRFQMSVSITPQLVGSVFVVAKVATISTVWIDPLITSV